MQSIQQIVSRCLVALGVASRKTTFLCHDMILADVDKLYMKRSNGGRGLIGVKDCVMMEVDSLEK